MERNIIPIVAAPKVEGTQTTEHATARSVHLTGAGASFCRAHTDCCGGLLQPSAKALWCTCAHLLFSSLPLNYFLHNVTWEALEALRNTGIFSEMMVVVIINEKGPKGGPFTGKVPKENE